MQNISYIKLSTLIFCIIISNLSFASNIIFFGTLDEQLTGQLNGIRMCYLDIAGIKLNEINNSLKNNTYVESSQIKNQYVSQFEDISKSFLCQYKAKELGVTKLPAIVFDNKYVIYGVLNLFDAHRLYQDYKDGEL